jgi:carbamoylphosphate synthase small subunit
VTGLTSLTGAVNNLITAYIGHTNQLLNGQGAGTEGIDTNALTQYLNNAGLSNQVSAPVPVKKEKKKRAKKEKDPNAPKRPLTAFFLFSTNARERVKEDLDNPTPVQVNDEVLRRWREMDDEGKKVGQTCLPKSGISC